MFCNMIFRSKQKIINWNLKWRLCDTKIWKWNSQKLTESKTTFDIPFILNRAISSRGYNRGCSTSLSYTTTDCTHSLNCVGVTFFLPCPRNIFIWPQLALQFRIHSPLGDHSLHSQTVTRNKIKKFNNKNFIFLECRQRKDIIRDFRQSELKKSCK